ncbi:uncharacterized protein PRCAT00001801001 [Priceomyces carsonii]|uniref:uncharacterized protein n=1 Tax=Priceomyces carsonii TaxID=28549 RepID=UPI002ED8A711|nr:unnamed protein product [Priceomyces carsonii]
MAPATVVCIGMAGSGKTTFVQRLNSHLHSKKTPPYLINLDPAVLKVPYGANIDIRDSVKYKKVMQEYNLGPNGAIVTSLNLFSTKIDQVIKLVEKRSDKVQHVIIDTPGQIECFVWSASGAIINEAFASTFPTVIAYIVDTPRNTSPTTFMSNMLYACSILYKTKLPMIVVFNKTDVTKADFAKEWMQDFEAFQNALKNDQELSGDGGSSGYMSSLVNSMSLMLEELYSQLDVVGVSSYNGEGFDDLLDSIDNKVEEYNTYYKSERDRILKDKEEQEKSRKVKSLDRLMNDLDMNDRNKKTGGDSEVLSDFENDNESDDYEGEVLRDEDEPEREYTFPENRDSEVNSRTDAELQARYQAAFNSTAKSASSDTAERIANYIKR